MELEQWLRENDRFVDWSLFASPWDQMQRKHNPFRDVQIDAILHSSGVLQSETAVVLDLGCGPGILGKTLLARRADAQYYGADGDALMLAAVEHLLPAQNTHILKADLRRPEWLLPFQNHFDAVVSLTALHWLSRQNLAELYRRIFSVLKPGGTLAVGDPYLPDSSTQKGRLQEFQAARALPETGQTWSEYWTALFARYPIKELYSRAQAGFQEEFEGSDDGYQLAFHLNSLTEAGFVDVADFWKCGLRAVFGGSKPA